MHRETAAHQRPRTWGRPRILSHLANEFATHGGSAGADWGTAQGFRSTPHCPLQEAKNAIVQFQLYGEVQARQLERHANREKAHESTRTIAWSDVKTGASIQLGNRERDSIQATSAGP